MSSPGDRDEGEARRASAEAPREAFVALEGAVSGLLEELEELRDRVRDAEEWGRELEGHLRDFVEGDRDPGELVARLQELDRSNKDLRERMERGKASVERLLSRIRFLEEQT